MKSQTRLSVRSTNQSNRSISVRLSFLFCSRAFISRSYENRSNWLTYHGGVFAGFTSSVLLCLGASCFGFLSNNVKRQGLVLILVSNEVAEHSLSRKAYLLTDQYMFTSLALTSLRLLDIMPI